MISRESLKKKALPAAAIAGGALALWGSVSVAGSPAEAPGAHPSNAMEAVPFAQGTSPSLQTPLPPRGPNNTYVGKLDHTTTFYDKANTHSVVGLWPVHGVRDVNVVCAAVGESVHMQADEVPAGNNPDSDNWYAVDEVTPLVGRDVQWVPAAKILIDQAVVPSCTPDVARR